MNLLKYKTHLIIILCLAIFFITSNQAQASLLDVAPCAKTGYCSLCDLMNVAIYFGTYLLGLAGALVLLIFVYGGFLMLTAAGKSEQISKGKNAMVNAVIGLVIAAGAYTIVDFVVVAVGGGTIDNYVGKITCADMPPQNTGFPEAPASGYTGKGYNTGGGTPTPGETCTPPPKCANNTECCSGTDYYCTNLGTCAGKLGKDQACAANLTKSNIANDMCTSNSCSSAGRCTEPTAVTCNPELCQPGFFCWSGDPKAKGNCEPQLEIGSDCSADKYRTQVVALGKPPVGACKKNGVCKKVGSICTSYMGPTCCSTLTLTPTYYCLPGESQGTTNDMCDSSSQCKSKYCRDNHAANDTDPTTTNWNGKCQDPVPKGQWCTFKKLDLVGANYCISNAICQKGSSCPILIGNNCE